MKAASHERERKWRDIKEREKAAFSVLLRHACDSLLGMRYDGAKDLFVTRRVTNAMHNITTARVDYETFHLLPSLYHLKNVTTSIFTESDIALDGEAMDDGSGRHFSTEALIEP